MQFARVCAFLLKTKTPTRALKLRSAFVRHWRPCLAMPRRAPPNLTEPRRAMPCNPQYKTSSIKKQGTNVPFDRILHARAIILDRRLAGRRRGFHGGSPAELRPSITGTAPKRPARPL